MRILHYTLGFPPHRSGGLVRYAIDLMQAQRDLGHDVFALYPGNFSFVSDTCSLKKAKSHDGITTFQLNNALPISLMYGIKNPVDFISPRRIEGFDTFMSNVNPDIFHIHTLMGLPKELIIMLKQHGIKIVYTSHDYFGLCPRVNFINYKGLVCKEANEINCKQCGMHSHGRVFLKIRNSELIIPLKKILR
ncbi:MAG: glycosyltransferase [Prevotellaceae bacterium]|nr:glycosyltransferase [Prevotellaceae bacterium]